MIQAPKAATYLKIATGTVLSRLTGRQAAIRYLADQLAGLPGLPAKLAQMMGVKAGVEVPDDRQPPLNPAEVGTLLREQAPALWRELVFLSHEAKVASLSQVHEGHLKDGRRVAVKVQFPGMPEAASEQLSSARSLFEKYGPRSIGAEDFGHLFAHLSATLARELDYLLEASGQNEAARLLSGSPWFRVPHVYEELSTRTVLVQEYVDSQPLECLLSLPLETRCRIGSSLFNGHLDGLLRRGVAQADFHPGNWGYDPESGRIVLFDFGALLRLSPSDAAALQRLAALPPSASAVDHLEAYAAVGFELPRLLAIADRLPELTSLFFEPFTRELAWTPSDWRFSPRASEVLGSDRWAFRAAGPAWFFDLMRSFGGVLSAVERLGARVSTDSAFRVQSGFSRGNGEERPVSSLHLKIRVTEEGVERVYLELPASSAAALEELVPEEARSRIEAQGLSLGALAERAKRTAFSPQSLFSADVGSKSYRVWLE